MATGILVGPASREFPVVTGLRAGRLCFAPAGTPAPTRTAGAAPVFPTTWSASLHQLRSVSVMGAKLFRIGIIPIRAQRSNMALVGAHLRVRPGNGQTRRSAPTDAGILQLKIEFVSSVRNRIGINPPTGPAR